MSYRTVEVELENGHVAPCGAEALQASAHALLTILQEAKPATAPVRTLGQAMRDLGVRGRGDFVDLSTNKAHRTISGDDAHGYGHGTAGSLVLPEG